VRLGGWIAGQPSSCGLAPELSSPCYSSCWTQHANETQRARPV